MSCRFLTTIKQCDHFDSMPFTANEFFVCVRRRKCCLCSEKEVWLCLECLKLHCSRFANSHALQHFNVKGHPVVFNLSTFSFWCYECNSYVTNELLELLRETVIQDKIENAIYYEPLFVSYDIEGVAKYIQKISPKNIIALVGAGMSTAAGIPDFRSPKTGLFHKLAKFNLPFPEAVFDIRFFPKDPAPFYEVMKDIFPGQNKYFPTRSHMLLKRFQDMNILKKVYTQNIDDLESVAGLREDKVVYSHGTFRTAHCLQCSKSFVTSDFIEDIKMGKILYCDCGGLIKPDVVFYHESLPENFFSNIDDDFDSCDMLLVFGTALVVYPFAALVDRVTPNCPRIVINRDLVGRDMDYDGEGRDVAILGDCDEIVNQLCSHLNWN
ncbi:NAD-dependent deacetylase sirtuin-2 [Entamoeba marina]